MRLTAGSGVAEALVISLMLMSCSTHIVSNAGAAPDAAAWQATTRGESDHAGTPDDSLPPYDETPMVALHGLAYKGLDNRELAIEYKDCYASTYCGTSLIPLGLGWFLADVAGDTGTALAVGIGLSAPLIVVGALYAAGALPAPGRAERAYRQITGEAPKATIPPSVLTRDGVRRAHDAIRRLAMQDRTARIASASLGGVVTLIAAGWVISAVDQNPLYSLSTGIVVVGAVLGVYRMATNPTEYERIYQSLPSP